MYVDNVSFRGSRTACNIPSCEVRCMVAVLLLVGQGLEEPSVVAELLDIEKHPRKPLYDLADESGCI